MKNSAHSASRRSRKQAICQRYAAGRKCELRYFAERFLVHSSFGNTGSGFFGGRCFSIRNKALPSLHLLAVHWLSRVRPKQKQV